MPYNSIPALASAVLAAMDDTATQLSMPSASMIVMKISTAAFCNRSNRMDGCKDCMIMDARIRSSTSFDRNSAISYGKGKHTHTIGDFSFSAREWCEVDLHVDFSFIVVWANLSLAWPIADRTLVRSDIRLPEDKIHYTAQAILQ